jgi:Bardet-Biedl syndrome 1 protein
VGTEANQVYVLSPDPANSSFLCKVTLPSAPALLSVSGVFDVEWRVAIMCRDGKFYSMKNGEVRGSAVLSGSIVDLGSFKSLLFVIVYVIF